uniref:Sec1 family domain-containing protein 1 n=1 Tax=Rhizochromulina marina TaxID=1034831 RepID=A0A7S2WCA8_9STRA|mmetsp:Transcript_19792/g.57772  ORF Transcript_19792/g.57772 Transcript_19792/m.57772 type:complete len:631 (+) Transcript_19792:117-2009(+)
MDLAGRNVKAKQLAALQRMLSLSQQERAGGEWGEQWKVLIYDRHGRDIISPLLDVSQLRKCGVTLHMFLDSEREPIPDVPAVYFCKPTPENVKRIAQDCSKKLYASVHLNFISKLERRLMEELARELIASDAVGSIAKVYDQFLDFVCLEPTLFSLNFAASYAAYNNPGLADAAIEQCMRRIADGLFSVFATLGALPIIRAPQEEGAPAMVAQQLHERLQQSLAQDKFFDRGSVVTTRPLLIILDRAVDFSTPLQHTCTYQALVDDVLDYKMNRVVITDADTGTKKPYDLEVEQDQFWRKFGPRLLPEAVDENHDEMNRIREKEKVIRAKTGQKQAEDVAAVATQAGAAAEDHATQDLLATVESLPQLLERKGKLEAHTRVMRAAMNVIEARELHKFYEAEHAEPPKMEELSRLFGPDSKGTLQDKLRLLTVLSLQATEATSAAVAEFEDVLTKTHASEPVELERGLQALKHIRQTQSLQQGPALSDPSTAAPGSGGVSRSGGLTSWVQSKTAGFIGQVQSFLSKSQSNYVTRVVDNLCEMRPGTEDETFVSLDARRKDQTPLSRDPTQRSKAPYRDVYVFMIGGGCYAEYQALQEYSAGSTERQISYGCTELVTPEGLLKELGAIGGGM